jgi:hypothetical protein
MHTINTSNILYKSLQKLDNEIKSLKAQEQLSKAQQREKEYDELKVLWENQVKKILH